MIKTEEKEDRFVVKDGVVIKAPSYSSVKPGDIEITRSGDKNRTFVPATASSLAVLLLETNANLKQIQEGIEEVSRHFQGRKQLPEWEDRLKELLAPLQTQIAEYLNRK